MSLWPEMKAPLESHFERNVQGEIVSVPTIMSYVTADTRAPFTRRNAAGSDGSVEGVTWDEADVSVWNGRLQSLNLD